jgi:hypothetical protein
MAAALDGDLTGVDFSEWIHPEEIKRYKLFP